MRDTRCSRQFAALIPVFAGVCLSFTAGCGGGSGGLSPTNVTPHPSLRLVQPGDHWQYTLQAQDAVTGIGLPNGTLDMTLASATFNGQAALALTATVTVPTFGQLGSGVTYLRQDPATRNVFYLGDNGGPSGAIRTTTSESGVFVPGTWTASTATSDHLVFNDHSTQDLSVTVTGMETVSTSLGVITTWKATESLSILGSGPQTINVAEDPAIGEPTRLSGVLKISGRNYNFTGTLISTNVPLS